MDNKKLQEMKRKVENTVDPKHKGFFHTRLFKVFATFFAIVIALILYNCVVRDTPSTPEEEAEQQAKEQYLDTFDVVGDYLFKTPQQKTTSKRKKRPKKTNRATLLPAYLPVKKSSNRLTCRATPSLRHLHRNLRRLRNRP